MFIYGFSMSVDTDEDQEIQTFSETTAEPVKAEELTEAEDQISDLENEVREDDDEYRQDHSEKIEYSDVDDMIDGSNKSKEELLAMDSYRLRSTRILNKVFEYGTPAGSDTPACPGCQPSNGDAADAAIIDAEITPVAPTVDPHKKPMNPSGGGSSDGFGSDDSFGDDSFGDDDFSFMTDLNTLTTFTSLCDKISQHDEKLTYLEYTLGCQLLGKESYIPAQENWDDYTFAHKITLRTIFVDLCKSAAHYAPSLFRGLWKMINSAKKFVVASARKLQRTYHELSDNSQELCKFWQTKMSKYILKVNQDKLTSEILGFEYKDWVHVVGVCVDILKTVHGSIEGLANSGNADTIMTKIVKEIQSLGIKTSSTETKTDVTELMKRWTRGSVIELGFTPQQMTGCMKLVEQVVSVLGRDDSVLHKSLVAVVNKAEATLDSIKNKKEIGEDVKKRSYQILQVNVSVRYITTIVDTIQRLLNRCVKQMYTICKKYEKAMTPEVS